MDEREFEELVSAYEKFCNDHRNSPSEEVLPSSNGHQNPGPPPPAGYNFEKACLATIRRRMAFNEQEKKITSRANQLNESQRSELKSALISIACHNENKPEVVASVLKIFKTIGYVDELKTK